MVSKALSNFENRLAEVQQLVDAHGALVRLRRAEEAHEQGNGDLAGIANIIDALVSPTKPGKPPQVQALNGAAIALLSGHLQGFVKDLYEEAASALLDGKVQNLEAVFSTAPTRGNPNTDNINKIFASIGFNKVMDGISWKKMSNDALKRKLREFNELRNRIAHGKGETVRKVQVENYMNTWTSFAKQLDREINRKLKDLNGHAPW